MKDILEVHTGLPFLFNKNLIDIITSQHYWHLSPDHIIKNVEAPGLASDTGFLFRSFSINQSPDVNNRNSNVNEIAYLIFKIILDNIEGYKFTNVKVHRFLWNYYNRSSQGVFHKDAHQEGNFCSIVYSLDSSDGGTFVNDIFIPSEGSKAILFDSKLDHKGQGPTVSKCRYCLNILFQYEDLEIT